jgi:hypothetical protein
MSAQAYPPTIDDIPHGFTEADGVHEQTWQEKYQADEATLKARAWPSDFLAAFRTAQAYFARECRDGLREAYGADWAKVVDQGFKVYAALIDAAAEDEESKSKVRRFPCPAWKAQTYLSRTALLPLDDEEFGRVSATLARGWRRMGWTWVHRLQLVSGVALFECDTIDFKENWDKKPATYTDRFTDLLLATIRRARASRSKKRVNKFDLAFEQCLKEFREQKLIPEYAPEAKKPDEKAARAKVKAEAQAMKQEPTVQVERIARRATAEAAKIVADLPADEALAVDIALVEWITDEWKKATGRVLPFPPVLPVLKMADTSFSATPETASSCASPQGQDCDFPAENDETASSQADNLSYETPARVSVEYDPEPEPRGQRLSEAEAALDAFVSVGAHACVAVVVDDALPFEESYVSDAHLTVSDFRRALPYYLEHNLENETRSLCVRFAGKEPSWDWYGTRRLIQADDCSEEEYTSLLPFSFFAIRTSPNNPRGYQVWMALSDEITDHEEFKRQKRRLYGKFNPAKDKKKLNGGAHGSVRLPGLLNRKPKHRYADGESPRVQLLSVTPGRITSLAELDAAGLLAPPPKGMTPEEVRELKAKLPSGGWPDINDYLGRAGDRSGPECGWAMASFKRGFPRYAIIAKLKEIGPKACTRDDDYAEQTVDAAWNFLTEQVGERVVA